MTIETSEEAGRALAAWLAPFIAQELGLDHGSKAQDSVRRVLAEPNVVADAAYTGEVCEEFVSALGDKVLINSKAFFTALGDDGEITSLQLADLIDVGSPRNIPAVLTTPLKRRAKAMNIGTLPWIEAATPDNRTLWIQMDSVTKRMFAATDREIKRRNLEGRS